MSTTTGTTPAPTPMPYTGRVVRGAVTLRKPTHALTFVGDTGTGGQDELKIRGEITARNACLVRIKVTSVKGVTSGRDYSGHLAGTIIDVPAARAILV